MAIHDKFCRCNRCDEAHQTIPKVLALLPSAEKTDAPKPCRNGDHLDGPDPDDGSLVTSDRGSVQSQAGLLMKAKDSLCFIGLIEHEDQRNALGTKQHRPVEDLTHRAELRKENFLLESQPGYCLASYALELDKERFKTLLQMPPNNKDVDINLIASLSPAQVKILGKDFADSDTLEPFQDGSQKCKIFDVQQSQHALKMNALHSVWNMCMRKSISNENLRNLFLSYRLGIGQMPTVDQANKKNQGQAYKKTDRDFSMPADHDINLFYDQFSSLDKDPNLQKTKILEEENLLSPLQFAELNLDREPLIPVEDSYHFQSTLLSSGYPGLWSHCRLPLADDRSKAKLHLSVEGGHGRNKNSSNSSSSCCAEASFSLPKDRSAGAQLCCNEGCEMSVLDADKMAECKLQFGETDKLIYAELLKEGSSSDLDDLNTNEKAEEEESEKEQLSSLKRNPESVTTTMNESKCKRRKRVRKGRLGTQCLQHDSKERKNGRKEKGGQAHYKQQNKKAARGLRGRKADLQEQDLDDKGLFKFASQREELSAKLKQDSDQQGMDQVSVEKQPVETSGQMQGADKPENGIFPTQVESGEVQRDMFDGRSLNKKEAILDGAVAGNSTRVRLAHPAKPEVDFEGMRYNRHADWLSKMNHCLHGPEGELSVVWWSVGRQKTTRAGRHRMVKNQPQILGNTINFKKVLCHPWDEDRLDLDSAKLTFLSSSNVTGGGNSGGNACGNGSSGSKGAGNSPHSSRASQGHSRRSNSSDGDDDEDKERRQERFQGTQLIADDQDPSKEPHSAFVPPADFKRYRKKQHGVASNDQLCHCLGQAGVGLGTLRQSSGIAEVNKCLSLCLHDTTCVTSPSLEDLMCCTCVVLHSLLSHFAVSPHDRSCQMCLQLFTLIAFHVQQCRDLQQKMEGQSNVCHRMIAGSMFVDEVVELAGDQVWAKIRKYLACALAQILVLPLDAYLESQAVEAASMTGAHIAASTETVQDPTSGQDMHATTAVGQSSVELASVSSSSAPPQMQAVPPKHSVLRRKPSSSKGSIKPIPEEDFSQLATTATESTSGSESLTMDVAQTTATVTAAVLAPTSSAVATMTPVPMLDVCNVRSSRMEEQEDMRPFIIKRAQEMEGGNVKPSSSSDDPYATQKTYGKTGFVSMPEDRQNYIAASQMLSLESKPTGTPGIGEVVYGTRRQLLHVARNWQRERDKCRSSGHCTYQHREEGVILDVCKKNLRILHTRYQKHHQWERLVHLGNGVTGKCHLCIDRTSNFKFCCKKIHILTYDYNELDIWSDLSHHNIVSFYGAIRHGQRIYLFAEFIDGGSLTSVINEQCHIGRRLSHWTALNYFRQLLDVLIYLQLRGVLHEDIKADNLLLREGTTEIVLADFGVAQRICNDHVPRGQSPAGSPAHWSPEKAASEGHGFPSDLWAAACVLIHVLSGSPPWIKRYRNADVLNFLIWSNPPPMDDVPASIRECVRDLIRCCLVKDPAVRPSAKQIRSHAAFQMLMNQASSFFSTFAQTLPAGNAEPDQGTTGVGSQDDQEPWQTDVVSPGTEPAAVIDMPKPQQNHHESFSCPKILGSCETGAECPATSLFGAAGCNDGSKPMIGLSQASTSGSEEFRVGAESGDSMTGGAAGWKAWQTEADNLNPADRISSVKLSVGPVCTTPVQHPSQGHGDVLPFCPEFLPDVPDSLVFDVNQSNRGTLSIPISPEVSQQSSHQEDQSSGLCPHGSEYDSISMRPPVSFPSDPKQLQNMETGKTATPEGAQPSIGVAGRDYLEKQIGSPSMAVPKTQSHRRLTVPLSISEVCHPEACNSVTTHEHFTFTAEEENNSWENTFTGKNPILDDFEDTGAVANRSVIPEDVEEISSASSREEHWWEFIKDQFAELLLDETVRQGPVCGQVQLQVYQGILPHDGDATAAVTVPGAPVDNSQDATSTIPALSRVATLPNFKELLCSVSGTLNSGNISAQNVATFLGCDTSQKDTNNENDQNVNLSAGLARYEVGQGTADSRAFPFKGDKEEGEESTRLESCGTHSSNEEHISSGDLFGPGPLQTEKPQVGAVSPSLFRKNPNLRLDMTKSTAPAVATRPLTAAASAEVSQHLSSVDSRRTHVTRQPQLHDERDTLSSKVSESSVFTPSSLIASPQSASALPGRERPRSGSSPHLGSGSSTPRSAYEQQEQAWNMLKEEIGWHLEPENPVEMVSSINFPKPLSCQEKASASGEQQEHQSSMSSSEESEMLSFLQGSICDKNIAGCCLNFYNHQQEHLFSLRMPNQHSSWRELVASVQSKVHNAGYQHFTLTYLETCTPVDFFAPPEGLLIQVSKVSEDNMDTCWCDSHLIHGD